MCSLFISVILQVSYSYSSKKLLLIRTTRRRPKYLFVKPITWYCIARNKGLAQIIVQIQDIFQLLFELLILPAVHLYPSLCSEMIPRSLYAQTFPIYAQFHIQFNLWHMLRAELARPSGYQTTAQGTAQMAISQMIRPVCSCLYTYASFSSFAGSA